MTHQSTKMLIEAGIIPKNTLQQLANWHLVPEDYVESHGVHPVVLDTSDPEKVSRFVKDLSVAITKDMAEIRETELDRAGDYRTVRVWYHDGASSGYAKDAFVDRLGRVVTPASEKLFDLVQLNGEEAPRKVVRREPRYEGDKVVSYVSYLEAKKEGSHV
jgi:hypothetical protein